MTIQSHILGFPRIGPNRETKKAVEAYWAGKSTQAELLAKAKDIRAKNVAVQTANNTSFVTVNDFAFYDHILDTSALLGAVPPRYNHPKGTPVDLDTYFRMGRGRAPTGEDAPAMAMTKWFDTNYHYMVPEISETLEFSLSTEKIFDEIKEAIDSGVPAEKVKPVLVGPTSYLYLGVEKSDNSEFKRVSVLDKVVKVYEEIFAKVKALGVKFIQIDEPVLVMDVEDEWRTAVKSSHEALSKCGLSVIVATYFADVAKENIDLFVNLPVAGLHVDLVRGPEQVETVLPKIGADKIVSLGVVNGRNIWRNDLSKTAEFVKSAVAAANRPTEKIFVASSCSLLHSPVDLDSEKKLSAEIKQWLAFATQKVIEVVTLTKLANGEACAAELKASDDAAAARKSSKKIHNQTVKDRVSAITPEMIDRANPYPVRAEAQKKSLGLPLFPTTTIGSFPQTPEIRRQRRLNKNGKLSDADYEKGMEKEITQMVEAQEKLDLDVLVHGEPERNDMVEYFGELLEGFAFTQYGWVQSYGSRCVKPPIIFGDVFRPTPMTTRWIKYAQSLTKKHMKGMLTGPVTILCWSFVRDDQPRETTAKQIALALRDEVVDLETVGIKVIQIDEPAFREGLPLRVAKHDEYLKWAVDSFKLSAAGVRDETQIHTHMCYSDFNVLIRPIADMDADVITIETSRGDMKLLKAFEDFNYPNEIGPGVYDIHSPRVPSLEEMVDLLKKAVAKIQKERVWVNPDCGLKTRGWKETNEALEKMVTAAKEMRKIHA
eukprot:augustus_masked-scaffold_13-processed-gene-11.82-mRNA-1 protein AED:0.03 eAED:0.03 QI:0/-1/0/1/-1/1/1/0/769